jgi:hypothetical protein
VGYYQQRVSEAKQRLRDGLFINWDGAIEDICALERARMPLVERHGPELEVPADKPKPTQGELLAELGF